MQALKAKYAVDPLRTLSFGGHNRYAWSASWRGLVTAIQGLSQALCRRIGNGQQTSFWEDVWLDKPLLEVVQTVPQDASLGAKVTDYVQDGYWNWDLLRHEEFAAYLL